MGHDEAQARQAALVKFVRLMKASANDMVSEVEAISYTGDITQLSNYELTVVISQLQAQLFSNLNPHRPSGMPTPAPEPTPATPATPAPKRLSLFSLFQEVEQNYDALHDALKAYNKPELVRSARSYKLAGKSALLKYTATQLIEELVTFVKNQRESWGTPTPDWEPAPAPAPAPAPEPARVPKTRKPQRGEPADWKTQHLVVQGVVAGEPEPGLSWLDNPEAFTL